MAKRFLLNTLANVLGEFIDISEENLNLSLAVWSGQIVLNNLKLKNHALLKSFNLEIIHGAIDKLEINIPWTALLNSPVKISIDGVYLLVASTKYDKSDIQDLHRREFERKLQKLEVADKFLGSGIGDEIKEPTKQGSDSYVQQLTTKILDNLEISLHNIHIRFEDSNTIPGLNLCGGITLASFSLATCNSNWQEAFMARSTNNAPISIFKLVKVQSLAIYWNEDKIGLASLEFSKWKAEMMNLIAKPDLNMSPRYKKNESLSELKYILEPKNTLTVHVTHNELYNSKTPKFDVEVQSSNLPLSIDGCQCYQIINVIKNYGAGKNSRAILRSYRPKIRPDCSVGARLWWRYAFNVITRKKRYMQLIKLSKGSVLGPILQNNFPKAMKEELNYMEERIPLHALVIFRQEAILELMKERKLHDEIIGPSTKTTSSQNESWWSWAKQMDEQGKSSRKLEEDVPISSILEKLDEKKVDEDKNSSADMLLFRLKIDSSSSLDVSLNSSAIIKAKMSLMLNASVSTLGISVRADLLDTVVEDKCTPTPVMPNVISVKKFTRRSDGRPQRMESTSASFSVLFESFRGKSKATISALPFVFSLNKTCIQNIMGLLAYISRSNQDNAANNITSASRNLSKNQLHSLDMPDNRSNGPSSSSSSSSSFAQFKPSHGDFEICFEAHAPKIIIPEDCSFEKGYLLLDTGYLIVNGFTGPEGMMWDVKLKDINAALPLSLKNFYQFDEQSLYLIKPFNVDVRVQNIDKSQGDLDIDVNVGPQIRGELNPAKLSRLLFVLQVISQSFNVPESILREILASSVEPLMSVSDTPMTSSKSNNPFHNVYTPTTTTTPIRGSSSSMDIDRMRSFEGENGTENDVADKYVEGDDEDDDDDDDALFGTPPDSDGGIVDPTFNDVPSPVARQSSSSKKRSSSGRSTPSSIRNQSPSIVEVERGELFSSVSSRRNQSMSMSPIKTKENTIVDLNPEHVKLRIVVSIPAIVLDLTYDDINGYHSILTLKDSSIHVFNRPFDMMIDFKMNGVSIEDSFRNIDQKFLARTPEDCHFIDIAFNKIANQASPLFRGYGNDIVVKFASLDLFCDINTVAHLKPFTSVLLAKNPPPVTVSGSDGNSTSQSMATPDRSAPSLSLSFAPLTRTLAAAMNAVNGPRDGSPGSWNQTPSSTLSPLNFIMNSQDSVKQEDGVPGTKILLTLDAISLNLLKPSFKGQEFEMLSPMFSLQITRLIADIKIMDLLDADVTLQSLEVTDLRSVSRDYAYKKIVGPFDRGLDLKSTSLIPGTGESNPNQLEEPIILHVTFRQETKQITFIQVDVFDATAYVSLDSILDFNDVFFSNFLGILDLLASSNPPAPMSTTATSSSGASSDIVSANVVDEENTMNIKVEVKNPRLIVLEDPTLVQSEAIVMTCGIDVHYMKVTKTDIDLKNVQESLHVSLKTLEVYVLRDVTKWSPHSVIDPLGIEFHLKKKSCNDVNIQTNISMDIDELNATITFRDILMVQSILTRRLIVESEISKVECANLSNNNSNNPNSNNGNSNNASALSPPISTQSSVTGDIAAEPSPTYFIALNMGNISIVTVNDYFGQNMPFFRLYIQLAKFYLEGYSNVFQGDGCFTLITDIFHSQMGVWEPVLEPWRPSISVLISQKSKLFELKSDKTCQLTISGRMLQVILEAFILLSVQQEQESQMALSDLVIVNKLGEGLDVEIYDSASGAPLALIPGLETFVVPKIRDNSRTAYVHASHYPQSIDVSFEGRWKDQRKPIYHLPLTIRSSRVYTANPSFMDESEKSKSLVLEPIVEEAYENARYDPILGKWKVPFLLGDPLQWTDSSGTVSRDISKIELVNNNWEWQHIWVVDMEGIIGEEIDTDGWEYSTSFSNLSIANKRRSHLPMDCVRRRRWIRTRYPKESSVDERYRSFNLIWDVQVLSNGSRKAYLRSGLVMENSLPLPIYLSLHHSSWNNDVEFGPLSPNDVFHVPLIYSYATSFRIRADSYDWSKVIPCCNQQYDFETVHDMICDGQSSKMQMRILSKQCKRSLTIKFLPHLVVFNGLPCSLEFNCQSTNGTQKESGSLRSGESVKLINVSVLLQPEIRIRVGKYSWSVFKPIKPSSPAKDTIELINSNNDVGLVLTMITSLESEHITWIKIVSKGLVMDYTGLELSLWSRIKPQKSIIRCTFSRSNDPLELKYSNDRPVLPHLVYPWDSLCSRMIVNGNRPYVAARLVLGEPLYIDRNVFWSYLPSQLQDAWYIRTSFDDRLSRSRQFIEFIIKRPCLVILMLDMKAACIPKWVVEDGFCRIMQHSVGRHRYGRNSVDYHFALYGKYFDPDIDGEVVTLKGNNGKDSGSMYVPVILPDPRFDLENRPVVPVPKEGLQSMNSYGFPEEEYGFSSSIVASKSTKKSSKNDGSSILKNDDQKPLSVAIDSSFVTSQMNSVPDDALERFSILFSQVDYSHRFDRKERSDRNDKNEIDKIWIDGGRSVSLFHSYDDIVTIGLLKGKIWSGDIDISLSKNIHTGYVEVISNMTGYQLYYSLGTLPGVFEYTETLTIMPRYCIVNCMDEVVYLTQKSSKDTLSVGPYQTEAWHKSDIRLPSVLLIRCDNTLWSIGSIDINEVGTSSIHLPLTVISDNMTSMPPFVVNVEVRQAEKTDKCAVVIVIWKTESRSQNNISIRNETEVPITLVQSGINFDSISVDSSLFEITVPPHQWYPFGWIDPDVENSVLITVGTSISKNSSKKRIASFPLNKSGGWLRIPDNLGRSGEVVLSTIAENGGRVLVISRMSSKYYEHFSESLDENENYSPPVDVAAQAMAFNLYLPSVGISLVLDRPSRREFLSLYIDGLSAQLRTHGPLTSFEFEIIDLQVDNYSDTMIYPVMIHSTKKEMYSSVDHGDGSDEQPSYVEEEDVHDRSVTTSPVKIHGMKDLSEVRPGEDTPLIQISVLKDTAPDISTLIFRYIAVRFLPIVFEIDSSTLQILYYDLIQPLKFVGGPQNNAQNDPSNWIRSHIKHVLSPENQLVKVNAYHAQKQSQSSRIFFEKLIVHPMKLILTFTRSPLPRKIGTSSMQSTMINFLTTFAAVDKMQLKLNSFEVEDALESSSSLMNFIVNRSLQDLQYQLGQIAGSLAVLGSPLGFARKVGNGVRAFFYEPYQGMVKSPQDFVVGLGKGTSSLFAGVVTGTLNSTVAFAGTAAKGMSYLSGETEYAPLNSKRSHTLRSNLHNLSSSNHPASTILESLADGGDSLVSGITSGVSGLVVKPFEEAKKKGALGFLQGLGLGLVGVAMKPMIGLTEGIASVASGISNTVDRPIYHHVRHPRVFHRSPYESSDLVITPVNVEAANAQYFVHHRAKEREYEDQFVSFIPLSTPEESIILSEVFLFWRNSSRSLWGRIWANISHCLLMDDDSVGIMLYAGAEYGRPEAVSIPCGDRKTALRVYAALAENRHRMGNPALVIPVDILECSEEWDKISDNGKNDAVNSNPKESTLGHSNLGPSWARKEALLVLRQGRAASLAGELDGYRFGSVNGTKLSQITGPESDVLARAIHDLGQPFRSLEDVDYRLWRLIWEWECTHVGLFAARCCACLILNRSDSHIQISRVQIVSGKNVRIMGSSANGYESDSRLIAPGGMVVIFVWAFARSPIEFGHLKANINTQAFTATIAANQRESKCESRPGFSVGFLEKSVSEWWSKYVLLVD